MTMSAMQPVTSPAAIEFAVFVPELRSSPVMTKQEEASPLRTIAGIYFFLLPQ